MAYELTEADVAHVWRWVGSDGHLIAGLEERHDWSHDSELGRYFLRALRRALA